MFFKTDKNGAIESVDPNRIASVIRSVQPAVVSVRTPSGDELTVADIAIDVRPNGVHILLDVPEAILSTELPELEYKDATPETEYDDAFFINGENGSVTWMYYNPDSVAGGQYVTNILSFKDILDAVQKCTSTDDFFDYLGSIASQTLADIGTEWFGEAEREFRRAPDLTDLTQATMKALIEIAKKNNGG